jgi:putative intracellular protease/amidase
MSLPYRNGKKKRSQSYILIGDGFDELEVIYFLHNFRQAGLSIKSVSLFDKLVYSRQGVGLKADFALADKPFDPMGENCLLILPSGGRNGDALRHDARVKSLLMEFNSGRGCVAITDSNKHLTEDVEQVFSDRLTLQHRGEQGLEDFVKSLTERFVYAS